MVLSFGEILLRLSPALNGHWIREATMPVYVGGAELNMAQALAQWKQPIRYMTAMPDHYLSDEMLEAISIQGVDISTVKRTGHRIGTYYLPQGADLKNAGVIYDRAYSSFGELQPGMIDWESVLQDCDWFHFSAISPALNKNSAAVCKEALQVASSKGLKISVDLNYRSRLWQYGQQPIEVMPELVQYCDWVMGNIWAAETMLGIRADKKLLDAAHPENCIQQAALSSEAIRTRFKRCVAVANTFRFSEENHLSYFGHLSTDKGEYVSKKYSTSHVIDKVGSGDCFMAGLIYGIKQQLPSQEILEYATSAAFGKLFEQGDATRQTIDQIKARYI